MSTPGTVTLKKDQLEKLTAILAASKKARVRVGIMGDKAVRADMFDPWDTSTDPAPPVISGLTNAQIGAKHEFGSKSEHLPQRSWLRMPLMQHFRTEVEKTGKPRKWIGAILKDGMGIVLKKLGLVAENTIQRGFETGGWGNWPALSAYTIAMKGSSSILIDSGQLRKSVTSKVVNAPS